MVLGTVLCLSQLAFSIECTYVIYVIKTSSQTCTPCHVLTTSLTSLLAMRLTMVIVSYLYWSCTPEFSLPDNFNGIKQPKECLISLENTPLFFLVIEKA